MGEYPTDDGLDLVSDPGGEGIVRHEQLETYALAFQTVNEIFQLTKSFPVEERYPMTDQIRRSSRSVCANLAEAWRKRRYRSAFQHSLNHAEAEAAETQTWIRFAQQCEYFEDEQGNRLYSAYDKLIRMLVRMITNPDPWLLPLSRPK
jgi:four helix bundle protein